MADQSIALAHHFSDVRQQREATTAGMWLFLVTEALLFGGLFLGYTVYRTAYSESFADASRHLDVMLGTINTAILIGSSLSMAMAHRASQLGNRKQIAINLALTALLGSIFLGVKAYEYQHKYHEHLVPGIRFDYAHAESHGSRSSAGENDHQLDPGAKSAGESEEDLHGREVMSSPFVAVPGPEVKHGAEQLYFLFYFMMTGLHAAHMVLGLGVILVLIVMARFSPLSSVSPMVEVTGLYWHFVDIVWIFLFPLLYLIGVG